MTSTPAAARVRWATSAPRVPSAARKTATERTVQESAGVRTALAATRGPESANVFSASPENFAKKVGLIKTKQN